MGPMGDEDVRREARARHRRVQSVNHECTAHDGGCAVDQQAPVTPHAESRRNKVQVRPLLRFMHAAFNGCPICKTASWA
jgi:hypothetical protein